MAGLIYLAINDLRWEGVLKEIIIEIYPGGFLALKQSNAKGS